MVVELIDGPLDGVLHEIQGLMMPESIGLVGSSGAERHFYKVSADKISAIYVRTEPIRDFTGGDHGHE